MAKKISINMLSSADKVAGQGVGSAYLEQVKLVKEGASDVFDIYVNAKIDTDIVHCHTIDPMYYLKMKKDKQVNVCYVHFLPDTLNGSIHLPEVFFQTFKKYVIQFYKKADYLVVVNPIFLNALEKYGISKDKMIYIPNYVSKEDFYQLPTSSISNIRKQYGISDDEFVVIGVGQVQMRKGVLDFVETAKKLPHIRFVWCGGFSFGKITDGYEELKEVVDHPPKNVTFLGIVPRERMNEIYNMANVLFMPSYNELFPMAILEACNTHVPLVLRDLDLYRDILFEKYDIGWDSDSFAKAINVLAEDSFVYDSACRRSEEISRFYCKEHVLQIWIDFYTRIYEAKFKKGN